MNKFDKFATTSGNFEDIKYSDMQHRKTYNYFNFQQNWSVDLRAHKCICKNHKLHIFVNTNSVFKKINYFRQASSYNVHVYKFLAKLGYYRAVKSMHTTLFAKKS